MPAKVPPPPDGTSPTPSSSPSSQPRSSGGGEPSFSTGKQTLNDLLAEATPEQRKKFFDLLLQNIARQIEKDNKKMVEELRREREEIEKDE